ncbi:hypothetical protein ACET3Z_013461 [Daucus carota]
MAPKKQKVKKSKKSKPAVQDNVDQLVDAGQETQPEITQSETTTTETKKNDMEVKAGRLKPGEKPDRAILWKKARQTAEGMVVDTGLSDVLKKIDNLLEMKEKVHPILHPLHCRTKTVVKQHLTKERLNQQLHQL